MRKLIQLILILLTCNHLATAQDSESFYKTGYDLRNSGSFEKSATLFSFGLGFPNSAVLHEHSGKPPLYIKYEHGFMRDEIGWGAYASYGWGAFNRKGYDISFNAFNVSSLMYYHFNKIIPVKQLDLYIGIGMGYRHISYSDADPIALTGTSDDNVIGAIRLGLRYYIVPKLAFYAETGYDGMSNINFGATFKFK
ncbi:MAG: hypothetical protein ABI663_04935 [Chryseolinea sp.]